MSLFRPAAMGRFSPDLLFTPRSVAVLGAETELGGTVMRNMLAAGFTGAVLPVGTGLDAVNGVLAYPDVPSLPVVPDLGVIATRPDDAGAAIAALGARGTHAVVCITPAPDTLATARAAGVRVLGPSSFGIAVPALGLNASTAHLQLRPGKLALVSQSAALCRAVLDWAEPNGVGFSHVVGVGGAADIGFGLVLDWLSRDPGTGAILLDIRTVRDRRRFLSAARAAARLRPVVAIHAGGRLADPDGRGDAVFAAALRRAGIVRVDTLPDLLAAAETLTRARPPRSEAIAIVTNAIGLGQMAADAAVRLDLPLAVLTPATRVAKTFTELHDQPAADRAGVADALVRVSQLIVDFPEIEALDINPMFADGDGVCAGDAWISLRDAGLLAEAAIAPYPAELAERWMAGDEPVIIRPIRPEDAEAHAELFARLSPEDIRYRFFSMLRALSPEQIARMTQVDYDREMAFIAVREATGETVGVSRLVREPYTSSGEFAVVVEQSMKGRGLARRLMQRIMEWGATQGMTGITGQVLSENAPMLAFVRKLGFDVHRLPDEGGVMEAVIALPAPAHA